MGSYRVVQWTSGKVARKALLAVLNHPELELVGLYAHSADKVGKDAGALCGAAPVGVRATQDVEALLSLRPDCVVYNPLYPDVAELSRILESGANVVTTSAFVTGWSLGEDGRRAIEQAALRGGASIFGSGMNPGFANLLATVCASVCHRYRHILVTESVDVSAFAGDGNMDELGWGSPPNAPGHGDRIAKATAVFGDALDLMAELAGVTLDERRCTTEFAYAKRDLDLPGRPIKAGHVAGLKVRWEGILAGRPVFELAQVWVMGSDVEPAMPVAHGYLVAVDGEPKIQARFMILPHQEDMSKMTLEDFHGLGMIITALPAVNAIPAVCAAEPGIRSYADLPLISGRGRLQLY
jgi:2,4-diaminopentanoate dehydrogenase